MACGTCGKRGRTAPVEKQRDITEGHAYLTDRQIKARLEVYKRRFCTACVKRYDCSYEIYVNCKERLK